MSSCQCCLTSHPLRLIERLNSSIQIIKLIRRNCSIFEAILLNEYEQLERISVNFNRYLIHYNTISNQIFFILSQFIKQLNNRLENLTKILYELECLTKNCTIWLKNNSIKSLRSQLKSYGKQLDLFIHLNKQYSYKTNLPKKFSIFQINYQQQCLQMDLIERDYLKLFLTSIQLFLLIISNETDRNIFPTINIDQDIKQWTEDNKFHITWLPNEHQQIEQSSSDIEIKAIENDNNQAKYAYESNLSWSFTIAKKEDDSSVS
ncbi:unnamed protein product [Adineta steineri]|uniref:Uncharacterized protein n=1 Tax=Adineta steineri TaxID=433720 RepID=A0A814KP27_9BILA|nr:unnamed protein product [Adineta steineri]CAF3984625.1 unnamed protein product [Adineta steineri]